MGLFGFGKKTDTFAGRVDRFWTEFAKEVDKIRAILDAKEYEKAMDIVDEKLKICLAEPYFMTGLIGEKVDLVLTPEGLKHRLLWLNFIKNKMPKELESKMICTLGKPRANIGDAGIKMYDIEVNSKDTLTYLDFGENFVDIKIYNSNLAGLLKEDESKAYNLAFILLDNIIGETAVINLLGKLEVLNEAQNDGIKLSELPNLIDEKFGSKAVTEPLKNFTVYEMTPKSSEIREDVIVGNTCLTNLLNEYLSNEREIYNEAYELGIKFCFLSIDHGGDVQLGHDTRGKVEDEDIEKYSSYLEVIGGATGECYSYIDLICFDEERLKDMLKELSKKYNLKIEIHDFKR